MCLDVRRHAHRLNLLVLLMLARSALSGPGPIRLLALHACLQLYIQGREAGGKPRPYRPPGR